ncbi:hypothetical protein [Stenotrophomonas hibiscicola]|uniref:hypothetical protein n=1 Tax=Stenotrophomonas hibiscicola TaxID=86189 RepID=UPI0003662CB8|nr:hypothetical protein [[Pseudomonas] hibiscicola]
MDAYENGNSLAHPAPHVWAERWEMIEKVKESQGGLTKRELFAAMAMQGLLASGWDHAGVPREGAETAVAYADHLLSALAE